MQQKRRTPNKQPRKRLGLHPSCNVALVAPALALVQHKVPVCQRSLFPFPIQHQHSICLGIIHPHHRVHSHVWDFPLVVYREQSL